MTEKENYLRVLRGEIPEWVPHFTYGFEQGLKNEHHATRMVEPELLIGHRLSGGGPDHWGVNHVATYETGNALLPEPNNFILKDIRQWRDVIKAPPLDGIDWDAMAKKDLARANIDRRETAVSMNLHIGYFQNLMNFLGFSEGLLALYEEPDEVHALLDYLCDFYEEVGLRYIDCLKPDVITFMDDTAAWHAPFISDDMYREFILPRHERWARHVRERELPMTMHNCGKCEGVIGMLVDMGIRLWDSAQTCNDLAGIKKRYAGKLAIAGGWDARGRLLEPDLTEEELRQSVRDTVDALAPGGGFVWCGGFMGPIDDGETQRKNEIIYDEIYNYGHGYYK